MSVNGHRSAFTDALVEWMNRKLVRNGAVVTADTQLFETGLIDSMAILKLIAWTERELGVVIPDDKIRMDFFRTPRRIAETFVNGERNAA